uniref:Uncharacterized protein n=1 Tax=Arundo donax TaxID=35708 RepID=A0A0A9A2T2_ARUDO
MYDKVSFR